MNITISLQEEVSRGNSRIEELSNRIGSVNTDLAKYVKQLEDVSTSLSNILSKLEKDTKSWENKLEMSRNSIDKDCKVLQSGIDENSKKVLEFENFLQQSKDKWSSLFKLEGTIRKAADKKFQELKGAIKVELKDEIKDITNVTTPPALPPEHLQAVKSDVIKVVLEEVKSAQLSVVTPDDLKVLRDEIMLSAESPRVTSDDLKKLRDEVLVHVQSHDNKLRNEFRSHNNSSSDDTVYNKLKDQAFAKRLNILIFGMADRNSEEEDLKDVHAFFTDKMGLSGLSINVTYRLGTFLQDMPHPRPLVVKFANIQDRWRVWNNKGKIPYDRESPIRIQEDVPRKLREDRCCRE